MKETSGPNSIREAVEALERGRLVVYPTETVYGLGGDALDSSVVEDVFEAKERSRTEAISMAVSDIDAILRYSRPDDVALSFIEEFLPGPVTPIVPKKEVVPDVLTAGSDLVGVRLPDHDVPVRIAQEFGPITSTSANISGEESPQSFDQLDSRILNSADIAIDAGVCTYGQGSTVVDTTSWEIIREGTFVDEVKSWIGENADV